jgi:hypothetical protein
MADSEIKKIKQTRMREHYRMSIRHAIVNLSQVPPEPAYSHHAARLPVKASIYLRN